MGRHQIPRHLRRRLIAAGTAAVCILGTAVGIGIYGAAQADNEQASRPVQCLPDVPPPASSEAPPPEEPPAEEPPAEEPPAEEPPAEEPPAEEPPAEEQPGEEPPAEEPPAEEPPAEEAPAEETPAEEAAPQGFGMASLLSARPPRGQQPTEEQPPAEEQPGEEPPAEEPPAEEPPAEEPPAEEPPAEQPPADEGEQGPPPPETVPPVDEDAPEDEFGDEDCTDELGPFAQDFVSIFEVGRNNLARGPRPTRNGSRGTFTTECGNNENGNFNSDNLIAAPGKVNAAEHIHDYVGNQEVNAQSTDESLAAAETSCENAEDQSAYFWPVLRVRNADGTGSGDDINPHNIGTILRPDVQLEFRGNARSDVVAMPRFLKMLTGNSKAQSTLQSTGEVANVNAKWTCTGFTNRITDKYPLCPRGSQVQRIDDFPSCWDGENTDSANHRDHVAFPDRRGACPEGMVAIPKLRVTLTWDVPRGRVFALDAFPAELHSPLTAHNDFINVMSEGLMAEVVNCVNSGRRC